MPGDDQLQAKTAKVSDEQASKLDDSVNVVDLNLPSTPPGQQHICKTFRDIDNLHHVLTTSKNSICNMLSLDYSRFHEVTIEQLKSTKVNKRLLGKMFLDVIAAGDRIGKTMTTHTIAPANFYTECEQLIGQAFQKLETSSSNFNDKLTTIAGRLQVIQSSIDDFESHAAGIKHQTGAGTRPSSPSAAQNTHRHGMESVPENPTPHITDVRPDYVSNELFEHLETLEFKKSNLKGRSVLQLGEAYHYTGSPAHRRSPITGPLLDLMNQIKSDFGDSMINSCLINKFKGSACHLPEHSDNEKSLLPGSSIYTVSLGEPAEITFRNLVDGQEIKHVADSKSIYIMSQPSQYYWSHRLDQCTDRPDEFVRYSITFRSVGGTYYKNSTVLLGDSNSKYIYLEGDEAAKGKKSTFGPQMPGKRVPTFHISQIDPQQCLGYQNIIVHVGVNDFNPRSKGRVESDPDPNNVPEHFENYVNKIECIQALCPYAKLILSPILPTKLEVYNKRAIEFNKLLFEYVRMRPNIKALNFNSFLGKNNLLDDNMGSYLNPHDPVHLGRAGIMKLASMFRDSIFRRDVDGRAYSSVADTSRARASAFPALGRDA